MEGGERESWGRGSLSTHFVSASADIRGDYRYAFRMKSPEVLFAATDPVGPANDEALASATGIVVAGWGTKADPARVALARTLMPTLHALRITSRGHPQHPLYIRSASPLAEWPAPTTSHTTGAAHESD
jgi:hypothetical protein